MIVKKVIKSFQYAFTGIFAMFQTETNARIHLVVMVLVVATGFYFSVEPWEWVAIILSIGFVLSAEAFNTALECLVDLVSPEQNPLAGKTKDIAAGAVLISTIMAVIIGGIVFLPRFLALLK